ncbi:dopamine receptor D4 related sequence [Vanacampus margaritifer]
MFVDSRRREGAAAFRHIFHVQMDGATSDRESPLMKYNYVALILGVLLILLVVLGNILVCVSVLTERSLQTATNYFIISMSAADLLLALLVLPLFAYSEFLGGKWTLGMTLCDALMTMDVMLCTASIFNLCAISVDRCIAVLVPLKYNQNQFSSRQLGLIAATWVLSLGVASPVIFGMNQVADRDLSTCKLEDDRFVVYSSVCSFFVPCPIMLLLYFWMFWGLRRRRSRTPLKDPCHRRSFCSTLVLALCHAKSLTDSVSDGEARTQRREGQRNRPKTVMRSRKASRVSRRERKAMKVLPVVVGAFLACWTPFFVVHVTKVFCGWCTVSPTLISVVTWLGYVNSAVNPVIYTAFNTAFRNVFHKILSRWM